MTSESEREPPTLISIYTGVGNCRSKYLSAMRLALGTSYADSLNFGRPNDLKRSLSHREPCEPVEAISSSSAECARDSTKRACCPERCGMCSNLHATEHATTHSTRATRKCVSRCLTDSFPPRVSAITVASFRRGTMGQGQTHQGEMRGTLHSAYT